MGPEGDPSAFLVCRRLSGLDYLVVFWEKTNNPILMYVSKGEGHFVESWKFLFAKVSTLLRIN